jgi:hypothetical protein
LGTGGTGARGAERRKDLAAQRADFRLGAAHVGDDASGLAGRRVRGPFWE